MFPFLMRRDSGPELVIRHKHPVVAMPVLPRRRDAYRVEGTTFSIEFVNVQPDAEGNPANHIHCV